MFHQTFVIFGVFYAYVFDAMTTYPVLIGVCAVWPFLHIFIALIMLPESPYYMTYKCKYNTEAIKDTIRCIKGKSNVNSDYRAIRVI